MEAVNILTLVRDDEGQDHLRRVVSRAIALVAIAAVTAAGTSVSAIFADVAAKLGGAAS